MAKLQKVCFDGGSISAGLVACCNIAAATVILSTCGSMSSDGSDVGGFSVIQPSSAQLGPQEPRIILGPFRFANHDCQPNCQARYSKSFQLGHLISWSPQILPIKKTNACVLVTLRGISDGEPLTIKYSAEGYHDEESPCQCASCKPASPPNAPRRQVDTSNFQPSSGKKRKRGGRRAKAKKLRGEVDL
jgi:hypothetical protein